jgi:hypothetical protein
VLEEFDIHVQKMNTQTYINDTKWLVDLSIKCKPLKIVGREEAENLGS